MERKARSEERGAESGKETAEENLTTGDYRLVTVPPVSKPRMHTDEDGRTRKGKPRMHADGRRSPRMKTWRLATTD